MASLTEQVTFKVSQETLAVLRERARAHGLDANPFARQLVEEGLESDRHAMLSDELRELLGLLRPVAMQLEAWNAAHATAADKQLAEDQLKQITDCVSQVANLTAQDLSNLKSAVLEQLQPIPGLFDQVFELRADLNKAFAALLHYQMGFSVEEAQRWVEARLSSKQR